MAQYIRNMKELEKALQPVLVNMVDKLADRVYETLNYSYWIIITGGHRKVTGGQKNFYIQR